jgi:hypothetical protein
MSIKTKIKKIIPERFYPILGVYVHNFKSIFNKGVFIEKDKKIVYVIATPHKVGSTWLYNIMRDLTGFWEVFPPYNKFRELRIVRIPLENLYSYLVSLKKGKGYLIKSHSFPPNDIKSVESSIKFITMFRDPRDVLVSSMHYATILGVEEGGWGDTFNNLEEKERLRQFVLNGDFIYDRFRAWQDYDNRLVIRYEDMKEDIEGCIQSVLDYGNLSNVSKESIRKSIDANSFIKKARRKVGKEDKKSFFRKGIVGDWTNHFDDELLELLYTHDNGKWKVLIEDLGYEL